MTDEKMKPFRAWVVWHPKESGICDVALSRASCEQRLTGAVRHLSETYEKFVAWHEAELAKLLNNGWIIQQVEVKPVEGE